MIASWVADTPPQPNRDLCTANAVTFVRFMSAAARLAVNTTENSFAKVPRAFLEDTTIRNSAFLAQVSVRIPKASHPRRFRRRSTP